MLSVQTNLVVNIMVKLHVKVVRASSKDQFEELYPINAVETKTVQLTNIIEISVNIVD